MIISNLNLRVSAGKAAPNPGIASSLGPKGVNLMQFWFIKNGLQLSDEICQIFLIFDLPKKCCGKNVKFTPINVSQKCILPKNSLYCLPEILPIQ